MLDKYNRSITYLRISITDNCNLRCTYCVPDGFIFKNQEDRLLSFDDIIEIVKAGSEIGITKIRLTGGEPLLRKGVEELVSRIKGVAGIKELTMTSNGVLLKRLAKPLKNAGLDRINISLDTLNPLKYEEITRGGNILNVLAAIDEVIAVGFKDTKINTVVMPEFNGNEIEKIRQFCQDKGLYLQRINHYSLSNINSIDKTYNAERPLACSVCNRIRVTADGKIKPCLFSDIEIPINFKNIKESLITAINIKPANGTKNTSRQNWQIGG